MESILQRSGIAIVAWIMSGLGAAAQAGMQLETPPAPAIPAPAAAAASKSRPAGKPRPASPPAAARQDDRAAWPACIRQLNAAALAAELEAESVQALLEQCST